MSCRSTNKLLFLAALLLSSCAAPPPRPAAPGALHQAPPDFRLKGRIGVRYQGQGYFGNLSWQHTDGRDELLLQSPLGQTVARIAHDGHGVELQTSGKDYRATDTAELTGQVLGWRLPLEGLRYWIAGAPEPGAPAEVERDAAENATRLRQNGWDIEYRDYRPQGAYLLPSRLVLKNGSLELKLVVDNWGVAQ